MRGRLEDKMGTAPNQPPSKRVPNSNIAGLFVERMGGNDVLGYLMTIPGLETSGDGGGAPSTFMVNISLIR